MNPDFTTYQLCEPVTFLSWVLFSFFINLAQETCSESFTESVCDQMKKTLTTFNKTLSQGKLLISLLQLLYTILYFIKGVLTPDYLYDFGQYVV